MQWCSYDRYSFHPVGLFHQNHTCPAKADNFRPGKTDIALTLSGHTHGMQLGFNYKDLKWSPIKYKYQHWAGLYQHNKQYLHVNRGLGWLGFPGRIGMRPEISSFEVVRGL